MSKVTGLNLLPTQRGPSCSAPCLSPTPLSAGVGFPLWSWLAHLLLPISSLRSSAPTSSVFPRIQGPGFSTQIGGCNGCSLVLGAQFSARHQKIKLGSSKPFQRPLPLEKEM